MNYRDDWLLSLSAGFDGAFAYPKGLYLWVTKNLTLLAKLQWTRKSHLHQALSVFTSCARVYRL